MATSFCPRCATPRTGNLRYCASCAYDFWGAAAGQGEPTTPTPAPAPGAGGTPEWVAQRRAAEASAPVRTNSPALTALTVFLLTGLGGLFLWSQLNKPAAAPSVNATPEPTAVPHRWSLDVGDATFTTETSVGGSINVGISLSNTGSGASPSTKLQFGEIDDYADIVGCIPECETSTFLGDIYAELQGVPAGGTLEVLVEFVATDVGAVEWSLGVYDSAEGGGDNVYFGTGTTVIR